MEREDRQTCYYYDAGTNHCRCYGNEALDELLAENARLQEEMRAARGDERPRGIRPDTP